MFYRLARNRNFWITFLGDVCLVLLAYYCAYLIRFEGVVPADHQVIYLQTAWWILIMKTGCFFGFDLYRGMWRYFSVHDLINMAKACLLSFVMMIFIILSVYRFEGFSRSVFVIDLLLCVLIIGGFRMTIRLFLVRRIKDWKHYIIRKRNTNVKKMVIVGAGSAGEKLLRELHENRDLDFDVMGFVDDDPKKFKHTLHGVPVLGSLQDLNAIVDKYGVHEIYIAVPSASARQMRRIVGFCKSTEVPFKTLPGIGELVEGKVTVSAVRDVRYEDLLGREAVDLDLGRIGSYLTGKRVMVTGGAGSIGSELCRQIGRFQPARLVIVDRNESGLYDLELDLRRTYPGVDTVAGLGAIQNHACMAHLFEIHHPHTVFHAAAYKHVPLMEENPWEVVFNNVVGSKTIIDLCESSGVERCVVVSTDKAVRPTNVMGASKRLIERITECHADSSNCRFMAVRFGNVLGSAGSVLPLFMRQIASGGPVTVTDPEVTRYFMTIPEACSLILQAGAIGQGNEIFVLKMGTPVKIDSMARDLITLSGFVPDREIGIQYTGLRPGEKLYEELITEDEDILPTVHRDIMVLMSETCLPAETLDAHISVLVDLALKRDGKGIKMRLSDAVPEYRPQFKDDSDGQAVIQLDKMKKPVADLKKIMADGYN
jgi:FlaA1/EpsC-like NDP-sugar epimerase